ncbi:ABC transporter substrate-binding protein [Acetobacterium paludosum]|uniref:ABC transporter substrate-binding protein n=1 Tax=Acetobacterium paludosum TaxID=52693 RepID=A0A923KXD7_9FIRM|nr:ABC transporter substrate-binding protein [Acetobacterium paludosum]MBC3889203.1 ABC transporter substrate-binding protein [Acetobacterium paludosum]
MKSSKRMIVLLLAMALCVFCFAGCTQSKAADTKGSTERTVTDMAGRTVTLPAEINKIGTFGAIGVLNTFVETMGAGDKICNEGSPTFVKSPSWSKYQYLFAPQLPNCLPFQGADSEILMENVLSVKPDLCLTMDSAMTAQLEAQGLTVIQLSWTKTDDVKECITLLGEVLNKQDVAKDYLSYFDDMVAKADKLTKNIAETDKKKVVYGTISQFTQPHIIAEWWIPEAGGISVTSASRTATTGETLTYTMEDLLQWNPDAMIVTDKSEKDKILADARFADLTAVKNNAIYIMPRIAHVWGNRTTEQPLTIMWTMNKLYPNIMSNKDLADDIKYFYSHFLKYDFTDEQIQEIIG